MCCFNLGGARSLTEHEIYVAGGARQMALDHDWLIPKVGDHLWLEKPPLLHWLVILSARIFGGFSEASARFPSAAAGVGVVIIMTMLALRWFGARAAVFTAFLQTTMVYFITYARLVEADMLLAFLVVLALFLFVRLQAIGTSIPTRSRHLALAFWAVVGLSNMAKGLGFGPVLILVPCAAFLILKRDGAAWRRLISWAGLGLGLAIALAWPVATALKSPQVRQLWEMEITKRATGGPGYDQPWWYYLTTPPWQLLPWTLALLVAAGTSLKRAWRQPESPDRFIWCWALAPLVALSLFRGKHHHYIIAPLCALTPLCAIGLLRFGTRIATACVALVVAGTMFVHAKILPDRDRSRDDRIFLKSVRGFVPPNVPLFATGGREIARHLFYVEPPPQGIWNPRHLNRFKGGPFYVISRKRDEARLTTLGRVDVIAESRQSRKEQSPADRFTLFRVEPVAPSPAIPASSP